MTTGPMTDGLPRRGGERKAPDTNSAFKKWLVGAGFLALVWQSLELAKPGVLPLDDFLEYWVAGQLLRSGENPYSPVQVLALQKAAGWPDHRPLMMWNPPWTLALTLPFSFSTYSISRLLWLYLNLALLLSCFWLLWQTDLGERRLLPVALALALLFYPCLLALKRGQISPLILLGVTLFVFLLKKDQLFWAGAAASLISIKPQLCYLFWIALAFWVWRERKWTVLGGSVVATSVMLFPVLLMDHQVLWQYWYAAIHHPPTDYAAPTWGTVLRLAFGNERVWLQFAPSLAGILWLLQHIRRNGMTWSWSEQMPLLLLVSLLTTTYGWQFDLVLLIPALLRVIARIGASQNQRAAWLAGIVYAVINALALAMNLLEARDVLFVWITPAILFGYYYSEEWSHKTLASA